MDDLKNTAVLSVLTLFFCLASLCAQAADEVVDVEVFNATSAVIHPGDDFSWTKSPDNAGHDFTINPGESQELTYYLPESRGARESFSYTQGDKRCHFSFGHIPQEPMSSWAKMPYSRWAKGEPVEYCSARLIDAADNDEYVRNGGTRIKFIMK
ncbi:hypothetical protein ACN1C3_21285 [Pseudomonas sp. H11T01]|uniref:hypothetical protein n=1 Tax=Pseudomonas sp. H11T01 TaxID=3402749 RepID=UPI003AC121A6